MIDWARHYGSIYSRLGVGVSLTIADSGEVKDLIAIDKTSGVETGDGVTISSIRPAAAVRATELEERGVTRDMLDGSTLVMNGGTWRVETHSLKPGPGGDRAGEVYLILSEAACG